MNKIIPYGRQNITAEDIAAVTEALYSDYLTQGPKIEAFENAFSNYIGCKYSVAVSNGTAALHLSAIALNVKQGSKVITTPITFAATANCIKYCGGEIVFCDIDPNTYLLDVNKVRQLLESEPMGTFQGIIPVDFAGLPTDLEKFRKLADEFGLWIIEDSCHSPGGYFIDRNDIKQNCGNGNFADLSIFSFHPVKHIACGEGGMITTNNEDLYKTLLKLRSHGITRNKNDFRNDSNWAKGNHTLFNENSDEFPGWYMEMQELGFNYRLTDFQAALGNSQLNKAEEGLKKRVSIAKKYEKAFLGKEWLISQSGYINGHAYHLYVIEVQNRYELYNHLKSNGILAQVHYIPVHLMPYYRNIGWKEGDFINAEKYYERCLSLPMYPTLTSDEQNYIIDKVLEFYNEKFGDNSSSGRK
jgi:UDP-4-amino-4,6-dideoxy-N-acetyl-beta-L-altrosamine transaminase